MEFSHSLNGSSMSHKLCLLGKLTSKSQITWPTLAWPKMPESFMLVEPRKKSICHQWLVAISRSVHQIRPVHTATQLPSSSRRKNLLWDIPLHLRRKLLLRAISKYKFRQYLRRAITLSSSLQFRMASYIKWFLACQSHWRQKGSIPHFRLGKHHQKWFARWHHEQLLHCSTPSELAHRSTHTNMPKYYAEDWKHAQKILATPMFTSIPNLVSVTFAWPLLILDWAMQIALVKMEGVAWM